MQTESAGNHSEEFPKAEQETITQCPPEETIRELKVKNAQLEEDLKHLQIKNNELQEKLELMSIQFKLFCSKYQVLKSKISSLNYFVETDLTASGAGNGTQGDQKPLAGAQTACNWTRSSGSGAESSKAGADNSKAGADNSNDGAQNSNDGAQDPKLWAQSLNRGALSLKAGALSLKPGALSSKAGALSLNYGAESLNRGALSLNRGAESLNRGALGSNDGAQRLACLLANLTGEDPQRIREIWEQIENNQTSESAIKSNAETVAGNAELPADFKLMLKKVISETVTKSKDQQRLKNAAVLNRLADEVILFLRQGTSNPAELKKLFNIGKSTLLRDVRVLKDSGWIVFQGGSRKGAYVRTKQFDETISKLPGKPLQA